MKYFIPVVLLILTATACNPLSETEILALNIADIEEYLAENNLTADVHDSGLHYIIKDAGSVNQPTVDNEVTVDYNGYLLNGNTFDDGVDVTFGLRNVIVGWQIGIPLISKGGVITLLIPSELAYGGNPPGGSSIPADAALIFDVTLKDFN